MKIALNLQAASWLGGRYYLQNLVLALRAHAPELELVTIGPADPDFAPLEHVGIIPDDADVVFPNWGLRGRTHAAQMHWIPDLQHRSLRGYFRLLDRLRRDRGYRRLGTNAPIVIVSSDVARAETAAAYPRLASKLRVLHFASAAPPPQTSGQDVVGRHGLPQRFVLLANQFWAHKNHETAFAAVRDLPLPLVCTGATEDHRNPQHFERLLTKLRDAGAQDRVKILGVVPREDYLTLVRTADALLQPSLFEGWSSTVEDARAYGRPIALSDIPVHREQAPPLGFFFAPRDAAALARAVHEAVATPPLPAAEAAERQAENVAAFAHRFVALAVEAANAAQCPR